MVGLVPDGLERYNIFLNSNVPHPKSAVCFSLLVSVSGEVKIFILKNLTVTRRRTVRQVWSRVSIFILDY